MGQQSGATKSRRPYLEQGPRSAISRLTAQLALAFVFGSALGGCSGDARSATPAPVAAIEAHDGSAAPVAPPVAAPPAPAPVWTESGPLTAEAREILRSIVADPAPPALVLGSHYWVSNESAHDVWRETIGKLGGALAGVGTDQLYLLAGWQEPSLLLALDFDAEVVRVHELYGIAFAKAETPEAFLQLWRDAAQDAGSWDALLAAGSADEAVQKRQHRTLDVAGTIISARLGQVKRRYAKIGVPCFLTDAGQYAKVRTLWQEGRVVALRGDLTATSAMLTAASAMRKLGVPLRTLYLSNAEKYFDYSPDFRANIIAQPFDETSLILRTRHSPRMGAVDGDVYHYNTQTGANFVAWMRDSKIPNSFDLLKRRVAEARRGMSHLDALPAASVAPTSPTKP
jgi:hypothetical protein